MKTKVLITAVLTTALALMIAVYAQPPGGGYGRGPGNTDGFGQGRGPIGFEDDGGPGGLGLGPCGQGLGPGRGMGFRCEGNLIQAVLPPPEDFFINTAEDLGLSTAQLNQLKTIVQNHINQTEPLMQALGNALRELRMALMEDNFSEAKVKSALENALKAEAASAEAHIATWIAIRNTLTPEQLEITGYLTSFPPPPVQRPFGGRPTNGDNNELGNNPRPPMPMPFPSVVMDIASPGFLFFSNFSGQLKLTKEQLSKLEALYISKRKEAILTLGRYTEAVRDIKKRITQPQTHIDDLNGLIRRVIVAERNASLLHLEIWSGIRNILTAEQFKTLREIINRPPPPGGPGRPDGFGPGKPGGPGRPDGQGRPGGGPGGRGQRSGPANVQ